MTTINESQKLLIKRAMEQLRQAQADLEAASQTNAAGRLSAMRMELELKLQRQERTVVL